MVRERWSVKLPNGKTMVLRQAAHESRPEFSGRAWCAIEDRITGRRCGGPTPAGTLVTITIDYPRDVTTYQSTGRPYVDRWERVRP